MRRERPKTSQHRRDVVRVLGAVAAANMFGCGRDSSTTPTTDGAGSATGTCVVRPQQTEGPYFVDERLNRSDIRSDPGSGAVRPGIPLRLGFRVSRLSGGACSALASAMVDVWHCDALGVYSDASDMGFNTRGQRFLRGFQPTDAAGLAQFTTIYPGWYSGRAVHIHFKIRIGGAQFTSQLYFDESLTDQVHAQPPYSGKGRRNTLNTQDGIFQGGGSQLLLAAAPEGSGYGASFDIALQL
jgi:protocatechuate 3,4-dioxygenase beta subunit